MPPRVFITIQERVDYVRQVRRSGRVSFTSLFPAPLLGVGRAGHPRPCGWIYARQGPATSSSPPPGPIYPSRPAKKRMTGGCGRLPERRLMATALAAGGSGGVGGMAVTCYGCHGNCERRGLRCLATPPWPPPPPPRASLSKRPTENLRISPPRPTFPSPPAPTPPLLLLQNSRRVLAVPRVVPALGFVHGGHKMASGSTEQRAS